MHIKIDKHRLPCIIMHAVQGFCIRAAPAARPSKGPALPPTGTSENGDFLLSLGRRVRESRNRRGLTRKQVSQQADVSERHLAQLEAGEGNISVVLLERIAGALQVPMASLFLPQTDEPAEERLIQSFLERLPQHRLEDVVFRLMRDFRHEEQMRLMRLALIGMRGAGKSTLGARLAAESDQRCVELDTEVARETGMPLGEIFALYGQAGFRAMEKRTLEKVLKANERAVVSTGGAVDSEK